MSNFNNHIESFYMKNPDLRNNPDILLAQVSSAVIPAMSTLLAIAARKGEMWIRGRFISKRDRNLLKAVGIDTNNRNLIREIRGLTANTRRSNNRSIVAYNNTKNKVNRYRGNNVDVIKRNANALNARKIRLYASILKTVLILILAIKLSFGLILEETSKIYNISVFDERTLPADINALTRVAYVLMNALIPTIYILIQKPAEQLLGGKNILESAVGVGSIVAVRGFSLDKVALRYMLGSIDALVSQASMIQKNSKAMFVLDMVKAYSPSTRDAVVDTGSKMLRISRNGLMKLHTWMGRATAAGITYRISKTISESKSLPPQQAPLLTRS